MKILASTAAGGETSLLCRQVVKVELKAEVSNPETRMGSHCRNVMPNVDASGKRRVRKSGNKGQLHPLQKSVQRSPRNASAQ